MHHSGQISLGTARPDDRAASQSFPAKTAENYVSARRWRRGSMEYGRETGASLARDRPVILDAAPILEPGRVHMDAYPPAAEADGVTTF